MAVNISEVLQKFQLRGAFSAGTQIIGKATGTNADPASYPISLFLRALFDMLSFDSEQKTITYIDKDGNPQQLHLGLEWKNFSDKEQQYIIDSVISGSVEYILSQLNTYVEAERQRMAAEAIRVSDENIRLESEKQRVLSEEERKASEVTRNNSENTRNDQEAARQQNEEQRKKNEAQRIIDENLRQTNTATAIRNAETATSNAQETAEHPTYFDEDLYQYKWDSASKSYVKTDVNAGTQLRVDYIYSSVAELEAETENIPDGKLAAINTGNVEDADNARFYIRFKGAWKYLVDLSGIQGAQGFTPQMFTGNVTVGADKSDTFVSVRQEGRDNLGNPKYYIDIKVPSFAYTDYTEEQIKELQSPANAMIAILEATDTAVQEHEKDRIAEEEKRVEAETIRIKEEEARAKEEKTRIAQEDARVKEEERRVTEVDSLIERLKNIEAGDMKMRIYNLETHALCIGETVGEDDEIDPEVWS